MRGILILGTLPKFNIAPEKLPKPNRKVVFQPPFFRGELLNFGEVSKPLRNEVDELMSLSPDTGYTGIRWPYPPVLQQAPYENFMDKVECEKKKSPLKSPVHLSLLDPSV